MDATSDTRYCPHCWPIKRTSHFPVKLSYYTNRLVKFVTWPIRKLVRLLVGRPKGNPNASWNTLLELLSFTGLVRFMSDVPDDALHPRSGMFFEEAKKRGLDITAANILGKRYTDDFRFTVNGKKYFYETIPLTMFPNSVEMDNKFLAKSILIENGFPVARGELFTNVDDAFEFGKEVGYPLVVKPNNGSLSNHVTCYITTDEDFREAMRVAKEYSPQFIVEQAIVGNVYRGTVVGDRLVFISQRDRANVVGDGVHTVQGLLNLKNADERRAQAFTTNASIHQVPVDAITHEYLKSQGQSLEYVPQAGEKVYLYSNKKYVPDRGNDIINCTPIAHPINKEMFLKIAKALDTELVGVDFIVGDITKPYTEQQAAVLETNSLPFIDMHQYPSHGEGDPVAKLTWDLMLERLSQ